jgi:hypothetical protein
VGSRIYTAEYKNDSTACPTKNNKPYPTYLTPLGSGFSVSED